MYLLLLVAMTAKRNSRRVEHFKTANVTIDFCSEHQNSTYLMSIIHVDFSLIFLAMEYVKSGRDVEVYTDFISGIFLFFYPHIIYTYKQ